jgi:hypothetical protein
MLSRYTATTFVTRSEMEERFLALCDDHGIRKPDVNIRIEGSGALQQVVQPVLDALPR